MSISFYFSKSILFSGNGDVSLRIQFIIQRWGLRHESKVENLTKLREAAKKVLFLVARPLWPLAPSPLGLVAIGTFFFTFKKVLFP